MSNLVNHARRELELCGQMAEDPAYSASLIAAVAAFASYGHSGGSAGVAIHQLHELLQFRTLSPLTNNPDEWFDHSDISSTPLWQNKRDPAAMSRDGGKTWYYVDDQQPGPATEAHNYVSTACEHGLHEQCRRTCKFCPAECLCPYCDHPVLEKTDE